ncbi:MAG TPA: SDR family NAD(P)-dependent oxidoreductase, partial [Myxococcales bacterium]|nr:SDR family NAD(P)-dependent oxidoreductase [Myxococcales bacterium]
MREAVRRCSRELSAEQVYPRLAELGLQLGPEFRGLHRLLVGAREAVGEVRCPNAPRSGPFRVPPQVLDSALHAIAALSAEEPASAQGALYLPVAIRQIQVRGRLTDRCVVHATLEDGPGEGLTGKVRVFDAAGALAVEVEGLSLRPSGEALTARSWARERVYAVRWEPRAGPSQATARRGAPWLWITPDEASARALGELARAEGQDDVAVAWPPGGAPRVVCGPAPAVPPLPDRWEAFLDGAGVERAVWIASPLEPEGVAAECERVLALCRGAARSRSTRLLVATFGAFGDAPDPSQSALWGLSRAFAREYPDRWGGLVDLPPDARADAGRVATAVLPGCDAEAWVRGTAVLEPKVRPCPLPPAPRQGELFSKDATYLVTGGLGGVGLALARWLRDRGAGHLLLMGRSAPTPEAAAALRELEQAGGKVQVVQGDVSRPEDVARALALPAASGWPALRGVFHLAGSVSDAVILNVDGARLRGALLPKVGGAWNLHRATASLPLDHFVLFSSLASLGTAGQSAYAAANAFVDGLARMRRAAGLPGLSLGLGAVGEVGMAARLEARGVRGASGVDPMPPDLTFAALGAVLPSPEPHVLLATASWPAFAAGLPPGAARLYSVLAGRAPAPDAAPGQGAGSFAARVK